MPTINVTEDDLSNPRSRGHLRTALQSWMLYPKDPQARHKYVHAVEVETFRRELNRNDAHVRLSSAQFDMVRNAPSASDIVKSTQGQRVYRKDGSSLHYGSIAGTVLLAAYESRDLPGRYSILNAVEEMQQFGRRALDQTFKTKIWPAFSSVAHLWGADELSGRIVWNDEIWDPRICLDFLAATHVLRIFGEGHTARTGPKIPFLDAKHTLKISPDFLAGLDPRLECQLSERFARHLTSSTKRKGKTHLIK